MTHQIPSRCVALIGAPRSGVSVLADALARLRPDIAWLDTSESSGLSPSACVTAADSVVVVMSAVQGLDHSTGALWEVAAHLPTTIVVTHLDQPRADLDESAAVCRRVLGSDVQIPYLPIHDDDGALAGFLDVLGDVILVTHVDGTHRLPTDDEHRTLTEAYREELVDLLIAESADDDTVLSVGRGGSLPTELLTTWLREGISAARLHVAFGLAMGTPRGDIGLDLVAAWVADTTGAIELHEAPVVTDTDGEPVGPVGVEGPGLALVLGRDTTGSVCRVLRGRLGNGQRVLAAGAGSTAGIVVAWSDADTAAAGAVAHLVEDLPAGTTLSDPAAPLIVQCGTVASG